nr:retrovirus-related Pol polyprotein from transposon TNT 1-94 [Tanacetum cinerariifolium]
MGDGLGGNNSLGIKKCRGSNSSDGDNTRDGVKIIGGVIGSGDGIGKCRGMEMERHGGLSWLNEKVVIVKFYRNKVWTLVPLPYEKTAIGSKWVFRNKKTKHGTTIKNKARLVAQGYSQKEGIDYDETIAPMPRMKAIKIFLAFATYMNFKVYQMDAKSTFLNGKLKEEFYIKQPPGFENSEFPDYVCKLDKALYGLKQAPRACSSVKTPMVPPNNLGPDLAGKPVNETSYKGMIRSLMYLTAMKRILRKSTLGAYQLLGGKLVCWSAKKQHSVAMFSAEAEYVAVAGCCTSILWMKIQLSDYDIHYKMVPIFYDNTSAISISNNPILHLRTMHIDIRYHFIKDHILKRNIELHFIPTKYQLANIFSNPLNEPTFTRLKAELGGYDSRVEMKRIKDAPPPRTFFFRLIQSAYLKFLVFNECSLSDGDLVILDEDDVVDGDLV